jgi:hypothetical protein
VAALSIPEEDMTLKQAEKRWTTFHDKEPREQIRIDSPWAKEWGLVGEATKVYYYSDKWEKDGEYIPYYHDHEGGVELWEPWGSQDWQERKKKKPCPSVPCAHGAVLGYCLGWELTTPDGEHLEVEFGDKEVFLCSTPGGKALFVVDPRSDEVLAVFCGGKLDVRKEGIVGN